MTKSYYQARLAKPCPVCKSHFVKGDPREVYCTLDCAIAPKIDQRGPNECWPWNAGLVRGYGAGTFQKRRYKATRVVLERKLGEPLGDRLALHTCDNPKCCNPQHLYAGTPQQNMDDKVKRGRCNGGRKGTPLTLHPKARFTEEEIAYIWRNRHEMRQVDLAQQFGVNRDVIFKIVSGKTWSKLTRTLD
jgi:hypothetical protein